MISSEVPMNDLGRMYLRHANELEAAALAVMRSKWWLHGPRTQDFCKAFADYVGVRHCVGVANGTDALEISLRAALSVKSPVGEVAREECGYRPEVITVANAGGYTTAACHAVGCTPVYVDIEPHSHLVSLPAILAALSDQTLAVVVTHLYGGLVDVPSIRKLLLDCGRDDVLIIEDCAQAHGAGGPSAMAGAIGDLATFSFYPTKNLGGLGDGGAIVTGSDIIAEHIRRLHQYGWSKRYDVAIPGGRNSRLDEVQAALLLAQLPHVGKYNGKRRQILNTYRASAANGIEFLTSRHSEVAHLAVLVTERRDNLGAHLRARGIESAIHYPILDCDQAGWKNLPQRISENLEVSRDAVSQILTVPCFPTMTDDEISRVSGALAEYCA